MRLWAIVLACLALGACGIANQPLSLAGSGTQRPQLPWPFYIHPTEEADRVAADHFGAAIAR